MKTEEGRRKKEQGTRKKKEEKKNEESSPAARGITTFCDTNIGTKKTLGCKECRDKLGILMLAALLRTQRLKLFQTLVLNPTHNQMVWSSICGKFIFEK